MSGWGLAGYMARLIVLSKFVNCFWIQIEIMAQMRKPACLASGAYASLKGLVLLMLACVCTALFGCVRSPDYWPTAGWELSSPEEQGMDSGALVPMFDYIREHSLNLHSLLVIRHGHLVVEAYFYPFDRNTLHDIASCTKSFTSTAIGIAADQGFLSLPQPIMDFFTDRDIAHHDQRKDAITIEHLLTMTSGLEAINEPTEITLENMLVHDDWVQFALDLPLTHAPGAHFSYNSCGSHLLSAIVSEATGRNAAAFLREALFVPIGINDSYWPEDPRQITHGFGNLRMTPRNMGRLGFLFLREGRWDNQTIVSKQWVHAATRNQTGTIGPEDGYGYQWWTYSLGSYYAAGRGGQRIFVLPLLDLVVVTTAGISPKEAEHYETLLEDYILAAVKTLRVPLPPNDSAVAALDAAVAAITLPPEPTQVPALPERAYEVSGKTWTFENNSIGWNAFSLSFKDGDDEAEMMLTIDGRNYYLLIGLDGVPRINNDSRIATGSRYGGQAVALEGAWDNETFVLEFDTLAVIDNGTARLDFEDETVLLEVYEKTHLQTTLTFQGSLQL